MSGFLDSVLPDEGVTWLLTLVALAAVWVPFLRGLRICLQAWAATERVAAGDLKRGTASSSAVEPIAMLMMRVLRKSLRQNDEQDAHPRDFIFDASRQYVMHEYASHYTSLISMYAGLLPPIGFIGTTGGMLILFLSMHLSDASLELGALAVALSSSVFALIAFSVLEGFKIRLYGRLLLCLGDVQALFDQADARRPQGEPQGSASPVAA